MTDEQAADNSYRCGFCRGYLPEATQWGIKRELVGHRPDCCFAAFLAKVGA